MFTPLFNFLPLQALMDSGQRIWLCKKPLAGLDLHQISRNDGLLTFLMREPRGKIAGGSRALYRMVRRIRHWYQRTLFTFVNELHDKVSDGASAGAES